MKMVYNLHLLLLPLVLNLVYVNALFKDNPKFGSFQGVLCIVLTPAVFLFFNLCELELDFLV